MSNAVQCLILDPNDDTRYILKSLEFILYTVPLKGECIKIENREFYVSNRQLVIKSCNNKKFILSLYSSYVWELTLRPLSPFSEKELAQFKKARWESFE